MARRIVPLLLSIALVAARPAAGEGLAVIVHGQRSDRPTVAEIAQIYLKQRRFWPDGVRIVPVNHPSDSARRAAFDRHVLGKKPAELVVYWNRQYFHGVLPPATLASDEAVKRFVASERQAIGYVDPRVVDDSVRVVLRLDHP